MTDKLIENGYDLIAKEYYSDLHITSKNFSDSTFHHFKVNDYANRFIDNSGLCLEVGAGKSHSQKYLQVSSSNLIISDISSEMLKNTKDESCLLKVKTNAQNTPFLNNSFDLITSFLYDPYNEEKFYHEIYRLLKKNGVFIGTLPHIEWGTLLRKNVDFPINKTRFKLANGSILQTKSFLMSNSQIAEMTQELFTPLVLENIYLVNPTKKISDHILIPAKDSRKSPYEIPIVQLIIMKKR